jgi:hypothetical protein
MALFKVRKVMQQNMTVSGEHDNDPYNFVEVAMKKVGKTRLSLLGCYYFFKLCDENPEVDTHHCMEMDNILKGNTDEDDRKADAYSNVRQQKKKERAYAAMEKMSIVAEDIALQMKETNRLAQQSQLIAVAQHLGKEEILEKLLSSFCSSSDD